MRRLSAIVCCAILAAACGGANPGTGSVGVAPADPPPAAPPPPSNVAITLRVEWSGDGEGTVGGTVGRCDTTCTRIPFSPGTRIVLDATAEPGSAFAGWGGPCSGSGECRFLMNEDTTVFVNFKKLNQPRYSVLQIQAIVGPGTQPVAMNARGQVVGNGARGPWIYDSRAATLRSVLPASETRTFVANGISANGDVALDLVGPDASGKATHHAFRFSNGNLLDVGTLGGGYSSAKVINAAGLVAGDATLPNGDFRAFLFDGRVQNLGALGGGESLAFAVNEKGWVTGQAQLASGPRHAFRYDGALHDLGSLGGAFARGQAINESGQVAGMSTLDPSVDEPVHAFFHDGTSMRDLGVLPGLPWSSATGLNNAGVVVGNVYAEDEKEEYDTHAFVYRDGKMWDLNELIPASPFKLFTSLSIDDSGRILCTDGQVGQMPANGYLLIPQ